MYYETLTNIDKDTNKQLKLLFKPMFKLFLARMSSRSKGSRRQQ